MILHCHVCDIHVFFTKKCWIFVLSHNDSNLILKIVDFFHEYWKIDKSILSNLETQKRKKYKYLTHLKYHDLLTLTEHFPLYFLRKKKVSVSIYSVFKYQRSPRIQLKKLINHCNVYIAPPLAFNWLQCM